MIEALVAKYDNSPHPPTEFYNHTVTKKLLMDGNNALITLWDGVLAEVPEVLIQSCDLHTFIDEYMQINYG